MALPAYATDQDAVLKDIPNDVKWRTVIPNYAKPKALFDKYKTSNHKAGSLEDIVQNLVKNWEKEVSHKTDPHQWDTVDLENYSFSCNGQNKHTGMEMLKKGTYNALLGDTIYYNSSAISFEDSHDAFRKTLGDGFAWEVLEVFSGPPNVTFSWRHFGKMTEEFASTGVSGVPYKVKPTNKMIELYGMCKATVNDKLKIQDLQVFYDPNQLFVQLLESCPHAPFASFQSKTSPASDQLSKLPLTDKKTESFEPSQSREPHQQAEPVRSSEMQETQRHHSAKQPKQRKQSSSSVISKIPQTHDQWQSAHPDQTIQSHQGQQSSHTFTPGHKYPLIRPHQPQQSSRASGTTHQHSAVHSYQGGQAAEPVLSAFQYLPAQQQRGNQQIPQATTFFHDPAHQSLQGWQPLQQSQLFPPAQAASEPYEYHHHHRRRHHHHHSSSAKDPSRR